MFSDLETFDIFGYGADVYKEQRDEIEDHLRFFAEECDNLEASKQLKSLCIDLWKFDPIYTKPWSLHDFFLNF